MLTISGLVVAGGVAYASAKTLPYFNAKLSGLLETFRAGESGLRTRLLGRKPRQALVTQLEEIPQEISPELQGANQAVKFSTVGLGLASVGALIYPILLMATIPISIYLFLPTFHAAYRSLRDEHRITMPVLDATRITVCIVMGYLFSAALNAWLESLSQRMLLQTKQNFEKMAATHFGQKPDTVWLFQDGAEVEVPFTEIQPGMVITVSTDEVIPVSGTVLFGSAWLDERIYSGADSPVFKEIGTHVHADTTVVQGQLFFLIEEVTEQENLADVTLTLQQGAKSKTFVQRLGEQSGDSMAPLSLLLFGLTLPFWGANRAAAFLTTSFGVQMRALGPYLRHNFVDLAARHQILIRDARVLEMANLINTVIIDVDTVADPDCHAEVKEMLTHLRRRSWPVQQALRQPFAIYLIGTGMKGSNHDIRIQQLAAELGFDDYFVEPLSMAKSALIERLQASGRMVCYVGSGVDDTSVMEKALVSVACRWSTKLTNDGAQAILLTPHPGQLHEFFSLANQFAAKEGASVVWPLVMDFVDIGTTVFVHLGLVYSLMMNYSGFFASALNGRVPLSRHLRQKNAPDSEAGDAYIDQYLPSPAQK